MAFAIMYIIISSPIFVSHSLVYLIFCPSCWSLSYHHSVFMSYIDLGVDIYLDTYMYTEAQEFLKSGPSSWHLWERRGPQWSKWMIHPPGICPLTSTHGAPAVVSGEQPPCVTWAPQWVVTDSSRSKSDSNNREALSGPLDNLYRKCSP